MLIAVLLALRSWEAAVVFGVSIAVVLVLVANSADYARRRKSS